MPRRIDYRLTKHGYYQSDNLKLGGTSELSEVACGLFVEMLSAPDTTTKPDLIAFTSVIVICIVCLSRACLMVGVYTGENLAVATPIPAWESNHISDTTHTSQIAQ